MDADEEGKERQGFCSSNVTPVRGVFVIQANSGAEKAAGVSEEEIKKMIAKSMKEFAAALLASEEE